VILFIFQFKWGYVILNHPVLVINTTGTDKYFTFMIAFPS